MRCKAKMIDGSPVTFEMVEYQVEVDSHPYLRTECSGEGFFVRSSTYAYWGGEAYRKSRIKLALERAGVDTATVEYEENFYQPDQPIGSIRWGDLRWVPLFLPVPKHSALRDEDVLSETERWAFGLLPRAPKENPDENMINAGLLELDRVWNSQFCNRKNIVRLVWRAMEKERTR